MEKLDLHNVSHEIATIIIDEFKRRLTNEDIDLEIAESIKQVKKIAKIRLDEIINE